MPAGRRINRNVAWQASAPLASTCGRGLETQGLHNRRRLIGLLAQRLRQFRGSAGAHHLPDANDPLGDLGVSHRRNHVVGDALVSAGLMLIVARIVTYRSNAWLVSANVAVLALTIYVCSFVTFAAVVADYNVAQDPQPRRGAADWRASTFRRWPLTRYLDNASRSQP